ncbi:hypothetical protein SAMN02745172_04343 [Pseudoxanthobacter soli DSM 19599]|uniref:Uncharacterized protein n=1 Tax=Pseudoxanthobacter soli DSM 19599 TaxID=1123029 RepID=A0A1M7ZS50_9HYPH|nr:hypothetical protein [Pseudoxanthobacter soli]SHO67662.1 hypothetical protein SAMN02745172_04343 [Pseudoxanthobacter soli DSM 19599]
MTMDFPRQLKRRTLTAIRDHPDGLLEEATEGELTLRTAMAPLREPEFTPKTATHRDELQPRPLDSGAQPSVSDELIPQFAIGRFSANGEPALLLSAHTVSTRHPIRAVVRERIALGYIRCFRAGAGLFTTLAKGHIGGPAEDRLDCFVEPKPIISSSNASAGGVRTAS